MSASEMREYMALIDKRTEVETLYANNTPIEYVVKSQSVDIWRHEAPVITPKRQNLVKDMGVPVWMSGFDALIDAIDILKNALQNNESPTIVDINRKLCVKYHTSTILRSFCPNSRSSF